MKLLGLLLLLIAGSAGAKTHSQPASLPRPLRDLATMLERDALRYFIDNTHALTGLVRDRARDFGATPDRGDYRIASIAATGFGMAAMAHACVRGRYDCADAKARILRALRFALDRAPNYRGWLYHFLDWKTGRRAAGSEVSTVDTAWFLCGALYAAGVFPDSEIARLTEALYARLDFPDMLTDGGSRPAKLTLSMGWSPETGYLEAQWDSYAEHLALLLLGLGHPLHPLPGAVWLAWSRPHETVDGGQDLIGPGLPLFAHQYSHLFVDWRGFRDAEGSDFFVNSALATARDRAFCRHHMRSATYRAGFWGLSASDSPDGYAAFSPLAENGTVCPACAAASVIFLPRTVLADLREWAESPYAARILGKYGFVDSINLDRAWIDTDVIGITVGALYLALADLEKIGSPWEVLAASTPLQRGLERARNATATFH